MDKPNKETNKKETPDKATTANSSDHNYSTSNESTSKSSLNSSNNVSSSNNKDNDAVVSQASSQARTKKRLKTNENVSSSSSKTNCSATDQVSSATSSTKKPTTVQRNHHHQIKTKEAQSSSSSSQISSTNCKESASDRMDADQSANNCENDYASSTSDGNESNNKKSNLSSTTCTASSAGQSLKETSGGGTSTKDPTVDQNLLKVPPLRIVITNSNKKDSSEKLVTSSSSMSTSVSLSSSSQIHSTSTSTNAFEKSFSIDNTNLSINVTSSSTLTSSTVTGSNLSSTNSFDDLDVDENASSSTKDQDLSNSLATGRVTRSQRAAAQQSTNDDNQTTEISNELVSASKSQDPNALASGKDLRKRKNRFKFSQTNRQHLTNDDDNDSTSSSNSSVNNRELNQLVNNQLQCLEKRQFQMPSYNCYHLYLKIRRQVDNRRTQQIHLVHPKIPENFNQFLFNTGSYLLDTEGNKFPNNTNQQQSSILSLRNDNLEIPSSIIGTSMHSLFIEQDLERRKLSLQHRIERDKLRLSAEQEILRVSVRYIIFIGLHFIAL